MNDVEGLEESPRFVLSAYETEALRYPRFCFTVGGKRKFGDDAKAMVVRVDPPSPAGSWGMKGDVHDPEMRKYLVLVARYPGHSIWDLDSSDLWARPVTAFRVKDVAALEAPEITPEMVTGNEWAEVHRSIQEVEEKVGRLHDVYVRSGRGFSF